MTAPILGHPERSLLLLSAIVDSSDDAIISKTLDGIITSWNKSAERLFGYTAEEAIGQSVTLLIPPDRLAEEPSILARLTRGERVDHFETRRRRKDGSLIDISLTISPIRDSTETIIGASKIARDITEWKRVQAEMLQVNYDLEQFAFSASHDLQEPLRSVKIYSELLTERFKDKLDSEALEYLGFLSAGAKRMEMLVRDLLLYTQAAKVESREEFVEADAALASAIGDLSASIAESGAEITSDPMPSVHVHPVHMQQLFQNLIGNAIKYRSPERPAAIHVTAARVDDLLVFAVRDNGIGIASQYTEKIFGLFKRLHPADEFSGTGIGLAICQRIVSQYRGRIWVESKLGQGSVFRFSIPDIRVR